MWKVLHARSGKPAETSPHRRGRSILAGRGSFANGVTVTSRVGSSSLARDGRVSPKSQIVSLTSPRKNPAGIVVSGEAGGMAFGRIVGAGLLNPESPVATGLQRGGLETAPCDRMVATCGTFIRIHRYALEIAGRPAGTGNRPHAPA